MRFLAMLNRNRRCAGRSLAVKITSCVWLLPELNRGALDVALGHLGVPFTCIGQMTADIEGLCFIRDGEPVTFDWKGYDHFATP